ncbi:helix-turn-helix protein [Krasilnikovia cinnamomea]|uniref:Helix-turn-helix protein n=1 Tax=Krasilnikovia cinnamomea TaxID=349313 RepID=A0A4Q7ZGE4_9ACTN|nr:helix-turn-helix transcriptional regulator [Krasilnikovia cinnamomea]RZU49454.1 helix-turn-helix protein [Krasilnikovia cinnamomea]
MDEPRLFGDALRRIRTERGLGVREFAKLVNHSKSVVSEWENGRKVPDEVTARRLDERLGTAGMLAAAARTPGANGHADRLAHVAAAPRTVDAATVHALAGVLANMRRLEDTIGADRLVIVSAEPLRLVQTLADEARGPVRRRVVDLAGQWAQFAGWLRAATARPQAARDWYARTLEHATEAQDPDLIATALSMRGNLAWIARHPDQVISLSEAAAEQARAPGIRAMAEQQRARGHALLGDTGDVDRLLDLAEEHLGAATEQPDGEPPWTYFYSPGYLRMQRGLAYRLLGRNGDAIEQLREGLADAGPELINAEFVAKYKIHLAQAHLAVGDTDVARRYLDEVRALAATTGSEQLARDVDRMEQALEG